MLSYLMLCLALPLWVIIASPSEIGLNEMTALLKYVRGACFFTYVMYVMLHVTIHGDFPYPLNLIHYYV